MTLQTTTGRKDRMDAEAKSQDLRKQQDNVLASQLHSFIPPRLDVGISSLKLLMAEMKYWWELWMTQVMISRSSLQLFLSLQHLVDLPYYTLLTCLCMFLNNWLAFCLNDRACIQNGLTTAISKYHSSYKFSQNKLFPCDCCRCSHSHDHYMNNCNLKWQLKAILCIYLKYTSLISRVLLPILPLQIIPDFLINLMKVLHTLKVFQWRKMPTISRL